MPSTISAGTTAGTAIAIAGDTTGNLAFQTNGTTTAMTIDTSQNVGIGTTSPANKLNVYDASAKASVLAHGYSVIGANANINNGCIQVGANGSASLRLDYDAVTGGTGTAAVYNTYAGALTFGTSNTERMRITSGGELLIGRTSTLNARLGILSSSGACSINCGDEADPSDYGMIQIVRNANQPDNKFHLAFIRGGNKIAGMGFLDNSDTLAIQNASNNAGAGVTLTNAATSWGTTSDERKKDIIAPVENALNKLADWRSVYYKYKNDEKDAPQRVGLIAQDVQATLPEAVSVEEDEIKTLQLRYTETIPLLVKAIQEQQAMIEELKQEVQLLKNPPVEGTE